MIFVVDRFFHLHIGFTISNEADVVNWKKSSGGWFNGNADTGMIKKQGSMISQISCFYKPYIADAISIRETLNEIPICSVSLVKKINEPVCPSLVRASAFMSDLAVRHIDPPSLIVDGFDFNMNEFSFWIKKKI